MNNEERYEELRNERLAELGVTKEQAQAVKELLETNNYKVDMEYYWSIQLKYDRYEDETHASLEFRNGIFTLHTSSSTWEYNSALVFAEQVTTTMKLLETIKSIAPTLVDPTFRNKKAEEARVAREDARRKQITMWNALPERTLVLTLPSGAKVEQVRSKAEYSPNQRTEFWVTFELDGQRFDVYPYLSKNGSILRKKFLDWNQRMLKEDAEALLGIMAELRARQQRARNGSF